MSQISSGVNEASTVDWNVVAAGAAVFVGTLIATIKGWTTGRKKVENNGDNHLSSDSSILREVIIVNREIRDNLLIHHHDITSLIRSIEDLTAVLRSHRRD